MSIEEKIKEFFDYRKAIKKPIKEPSKKAFLRRLNSLSNNDENTMIEILEQSIANGWQGIFELRSKNNIQPISKIDQMANAHFEAKKKLGIA